MGGGPLRRVAEVGEIDLTDPEARFVAMLQLRVLTMPGPARRGDAGAGQ